MPERGQIEIEIRDGSTGPGAEVVVAGEVDLETSGPLQAALDGAIDSSPGDVSVDLAGVGLIDAAGIGVLVRAANRIEGHGGRLTLRAPSQAVTRVLDAVELDGVLGVET